MNVFKNVILGILLVTASSIQAQDKIEGVGFAGDRNETFTLGTQESVTIWKTWCTLHEEKNVEEILKLAGDNIRIEGPGGELIIEGKENFKGFLTSWFNDLELIQVRQRWGLPMKFINAEGQLGSGEWLVSGHAFKYKNAEGTSIEDNQVNVFINEGKVQYMKVYQHKISKPIEVELSVDMSSYKDAYKTVSVFGSFNNWCNTCNQLYDTDGDGVYTTTIEVVPGDMEYKFFLDDQKVEETFEAGTQCTKTTDIYTNRLASITKDTSYLDVVCFNTCSDCE